MKLKEVHYPYPVLTPYADDIVGEKFAADVSFKFDNDAAHFQVKYDLKNEDLLKLIEQDHARFVTQINCQSTYQRFVFSTNDSYDSFTIENHLLNESVYANFFIVANSDLESYTNTQFHSDFEGETFSIKKGERLAVAQTMQIELEKEPISNASSIFQLIPNFENPDEQIQVSCLDKIIIRIPSDEHREVQHLSSYGERYNTVLISLYYVPALIEALYEISSANAANNLEEWEDREWFKTISHRLEVLGYEVSEITPETNLINLAFKILDNPTGKSLALIESQWEEE